jgi:adenylate kinase family enzyme
MAIMQRITICGNSGSGKSTFAEELGKSSGLPVYHLDLIQFRPGWQKTPEPDFNKKHDNWLTQTCWIIEGVGNWKPLVKRFSAADTIIYLDFPVDYCLEMAQKRLGLDKISPNPYLPANCPYNAKTNKQEAVIRFFQQEWRPKILALMESLRENRNLYFFTRPEALQDFLAETKLPFSE